MQTKLGWVLLAGSLALAGCGEQLSGSYADDTGITRYTFGDNGTVEISVLGTEAIAEYRLDGDKVLVSSAQGTVILTRHDDRLYGPMGLELVQQKSKKGEKRWH